MAKTDKQKTVNNEYDDQSSETKKRKKYKGVRMRSWGSWVSEIRPPNQKTKIWLGSHSTPEAAARAYDAASVCLKGSSTTLNFPHSSYYIPETVPSPRSIQKIAGAAAESPPSEATHCHVDNAPASSSISGYSYHVDGFGSFDGYVPSMAEPWYALEEMTSSDMYQYQGNVYDYQSLGGEDNYEYGDIRLWNFDE